MEIAASLDLTIYWFNDAEQWLISSPSAIFTVVDPQSELDSLNVAVGSVSFIPAAGCEGIPTPCNHWTITASDVLTLDVMYTARIPIGNGSGFNIKAEASVPTAVGDDTYVPREHLLAQNYPNPFNPITTIEYRVERPGEVEVAIYDVSGRVVRSLVRASRERGQYTVRWDGRDDVGRRVTTGTYFYRLVVGEIRETRKMVVIK